VDGTGRKLLAQIGAGLGSIAAACDQLPDIEVAAVCCHLADRLQAAIELMLEGARVDGRAGEVREAIADLERLLVAKRTSP
jgi:hypothetical protein